MTTIITSVQEYLDQIKGIKIIHNVFFRGHADSDYVLKPGIYREIKDKGGKTLIKYEDQIYREVISKSPQEFLGKTTLESLALLQHYEAPTRVLDLTENALVALFFAVNKGDSKSDGEVIIFDIPDESVCHYNSDRITILSNLAKCDEYFTYNEKLVPTYRQKIEQLHKIKKSISPFGSIIESDIIDFYHTNFKAIEKSFVDVDKFELHNYKQRIEELQITFEKDIRKLDYKEIIKFENQYIEILIEILYSVVNFSIVDCNHTFFGKLLHNIREDKSYFDGIIDPSHLSQVFAVRPKLDNPRIVRQQGAFLIFGMKPLIITGFSDPKPMAELDKKWVIKGFDDERIIIDKDSKNLILKELEQLGINQSILFPEVDKVADFVSRKYQNKL